MDRKKIERSLAGIKKSVVSKFPDAKVLVTGSFATGGYIHGSSDVDILIISKSFKGKNLVERIHSITPVIDYPEFPIDIIPLLPGEFSRKSKSRLNTLYYMARSARAI